MAGDWRLSSSMDRVLPHLHLQPVGRSFPEADTLIDFILEKNEKDVKIICEGVAKDIGWVGGCVGVLMPTGMA
jgi:hypothetical protein